MTETDTDATVRERILAANPDYEAIARAFEELDAPMAMLEAMKSLKAREQARLFEICEAAEPLTVSDLVPPAPDPDVTYIWEGVNSLPFFRRFQKRVTLTDDPELLAGYNHQSMKWLVGPGCFTARETEEGKPGSVVFDYTMTPNVQPEGWPKVVRADKGISRFVYGNMKDYMRRVTDDLLIGWAWRHGKETGNYFLLWRSPETA